MFAGKASFYQYILYKLVHNSLKDTSVGSVFVRESQIRRILRKYCKAKYCKYWAKAATQSL